MMPEWLRNNWGNLIVGLTLLAVIAGIIVHLIRERRAGKCSCGCSGCSGKKCRR